MPATTPARELTVTWDDPAAARLQTRELNGRAWLEGIRDGTVTPPPAARLLDIRLDEVEDGHVVFSMEPREAGYNPAGTVHGGILTVLADTAMTTAIISQLPAGAWAPTIELKMNFIRPVTEATGRISAVGTVIHVGSAVAVAESKILDANGVLYVHATATCAVKRPAPPPDDSDRVPDRHGGALRAARGT